MKEDILKDLGMDEQEFLNSSGIYDTPKRELLQLIEEAIFKNLPELKEPILKISEAFEKLNEEERHLTLIYLLNYLSLGRQEFFLTQSHEIVSKVIEKKIEHAVMIGLLKNLSN